MQVPASFCRNSHNKKTAECLLCPHRCVIEPEKRGICAVRKNFAGSIESLNYGEVTSVSMDPIEKKPLYHFYPGQKIFSVGTKGCNLHCCFCQNSSISQNPEAPSDECTPEMLVKAARMENSIGLAYTYSEPVVWYEFVYDTAVCARSYGLKNVLVTNGFINREPLLNLLPYIDAANIDLKFFTEEHYRTFAGGSLRPVLDAIECAHDHIHIELTTLVVTGINDTIEEMRSIINWIASLDKNIPWHISRYHPSYKYNALPTDVDFLKRVYGEAREVLPFVYIGNIPHGDSFSNTMCPSCGSLLIERRGYSTHVRGLNANVCMKCGDKIPIVGL